MDVPAHQETVREWIDVPAEPVTVVSQGDPRLAAPSPGTTRVMTEAEFQRTVASVK